MSDTPRTDAVFDEAWVFVKGQPRGQHDYCLMAAHARQLERELAAERARVEGLQQALGIWLPCIAGEESEAGELAAEHSYLLAGYMGPLEKDAEERGWIIVTDSVRGNP